MVFKGNACFFPDPLKLWVYRQPAKFLSKFAAGMKNLSSILKPTSRSLLVTGMMFLLLPVLFFTPSCKKESPDPVPAPQSLQVWLHRVNTIGKAQHFRNNYSGFELDVHYDTVVKTFIVKHNATDTSTLTLPVWLSFISSPEKLGYWLDFKNLTPENGPAALSELLRIRQAFNLEEHLIVVESDNTPALPPFDTLNFRISFYIPWFDPEGITPEQEEAWKDYIQANVTSTGIKTISGYSFQHDMMTKWFPEMNKLLWYLDSYDQALKDSVITLTRKDASVEILLVAEDYP
jgi:hypothetical protein